MYYLEKKINFYNDEILTFFEEGTKKVYVSIKHICDNLGMNKSQRDHQLQKVRNDGTLKGACKFNPLSTNGGLQQVLMIELEFLTIWLVKINPARFSEELKNKLKMYQLKCKDILSEAFFGKRELKQEVKRYNVDLNLIEDRAGTLRGIENEKRKLTLKQIYIYTRIEYTAHSMVEKLRREYKKSLESEIIRNGRALTTEEVDAIDTSLIEQIKNESEK